MKFDCMYMHSEAKLKHHMEQKNIEGVIRTPLDIFEVTNGNVLLAMRNEDAGFQGFGDAYFSFVNQGAIKGWKKHKQITLNITVPIGAIRFVLYDDRTESTTQGMFQVITLSPRHYYRLTVPKGVWMAFEGLAEGPNMLMNISDYKYNPTESENLPLNTPNIPFDFGVLKV